MHFLTNSIRCIHSKVAKSNLLEGVCFMQFLKYLQAMILERRNVLRKFDNATIKKLTSIELWKELYVFYEKRECNLQENKANVYLLNFHATCRHRQRKQTL